MRDNYWWIASYPVCRQTGSQWKGVVMTGCRNDRVVYSRHCEERSNLCSCEWIASLRSQWKGDCFTAFAMTGCRNDRDRNDRDRNDGEIWYLAFVKPYCAINMQKFVWELFWVIIIVTIIVVTDVYIRNTVCLAWKKS